MANYLGFKHGDRVRILDDYYSNQPEHQYGTVVYAGVKTPDNVLIKFQKPLTFKGHDGDYAGGFPECEGSCWFIQDQFVEKVKNACIGNINLEDL